MTSPDNSPDDSLERALGAPQTRIAGVDEAGRGAWAGPVVAAAVILDMANIPAGIRDSKQLTRAARRQLFSRLTGGNHLHAVGLVEREVIDRLNILHAAMEAMRLAVSRLAPQPKALLIDGNRLPPLPPELAANAQAIVKGDARSLSIAAASIIAKVTRDDIMGELSRIDPRYGWERNAGYGTKEHQAALRRFGPSNQHRRSFAPIRNILIL